MSRSGVRIATFQSLVEADLARAKLKAHAIESNIETDDVGGAHPHLQRAGVHLVVHEAHAERAAAILSRSEAPAEAAPGNLAEAEESVRKREPYHVGVLDRRLLYALPLLALGAIAGFILSESGILESRHNVFLYADAVEVDRNLDGRIDEWLVYRGSEIVRSRVDRNFDGEPDHWTFFRDGLAARSELDDNFDGDVDGWLKYRSGDISRSRFDIDHNGIPDHSIEYRHGVPVSSRLHPNGGPVEREERYEDGALREVYQVSPAGSRTLIRSYDRLGRELTTPE